MNCQNCRAALESDSDRAERINAVSSVPCQCETHSVSDYSPGCVHDDEWLHYLVPTPEGRTANGHLDPGMLVQVDRNGLSVLRECADNSEFVSSLQELLPRWQTKEKTLEGVMTFRASQVRFDDEGERLCCVYDTGMAHKPAHADLMAPSISNDTAVSNTQINKLKRARIKKIVDRIGNQFELASQFRDGYLTFE
jgi:hypothetical protein